MNATWNATSALLAMQQQLDQLAAEAAQTKRSVNIFYLLIMFPVVFLMSAGFSMLESGSVRTRSVRHILLKTAMTWLIAGFNWYFVGFGESFGAGNGFIGTEDYLVLDSENYALWVYEFVFMAASATILSGAVAERITMWAYLIYCFFFTAWVYPVFAHWLWGSGGWLNPAHAAVGQYGALDFAGGAPVHIVGGSMSLVAAWIIGPRLCRFTRLFDDTIVKEATAADQVLGMWLLWFGWFAFNTGSTLIITDGWANVAQLAAANTLLCPCVAGLTSCLVAIVISRGTFQVPEIVNGVLAGLVAITPACGFVELWASFPIGAVAGLVYHGTTWLLLRAKIDDPVEATAVHMAPGIWGTWATGLFAARHRVAFFVGIASEDLDTWGAFMGGGGKLFGMQILSSVVAVTWAITWACAIFLPMHFLKILRVSEAIEMSGLDMTRKPARHTVMPAPPPSDDRDPA